MAKYFILIKKSLFFSNYSGDNITILYNIYIAETNAINNFIFGGVIYSYILLIFTEDITAYSQLAK